MTEKEGGNDCCDESPIDTTLMGEIEPGLWVGGLGAIKEIRKRVCPWTVVSAMKAEKLSMFLDKTLGEIQEFHPNITIDHVAWDIADKSRSEFMCDRLEEILAKIDQRILRTPPPPTTAPASAAEHDDDSEPGCCLVHCAFGVSRSVSICAAWLISRRKLTMWQALQKIRAVRPDASPNVGFLASLRALEQCGGDVQAAKQRMHSRRSSSA